MPVSVTCQCGARLEIDENFLGKEIPCPDCQRPLPTKGPATPPPLDLPDYHRTSGLAVLSLTLALVGAFTIVGTLAAIVVGVFALREISNKSSKLEGAGYARAGIIVGAVCTFLALAGFASPFVFGIDSVLRYAALSPRVQFPDGNDIQNNTGGGDNNITLTRQSTLWGRYVSPNQPGGIDPDDLIMVNIWEDAFIACQTVPNDGGAANEEEITKKALDKLVKSELIDVIFRLKNRPLGEEPVIVENKLVQGNSKREVTVDLRNRRFLVQFRAGELNAQQFHVMVGAARRNRFERMVDEFRKTFDTKK
jgi:hypothetical protein